MRNKQHMDLKRECQDSVGAGSHTKSALYPTRMANSRLATGEERSRDIRKKKLLRWIQGEMGQRLNWSRGLVE